MIPDTHRAHGEIVSLRKQIAQTIDEMKSFLSLLDDILYQTFSDPHDEAILDFVEGRVAYVKYVTRCISAFEDYQMIERKYPQKSFTPERTHFRDIGFSLWHRSLDRKCYTLDLDFLEMRKEGGIWNPKMIYDVKRAPYDADKLKNTNVAMYKLVADALDIPFAVISHRYDMSQFTMYSIESASPNLKYQKELFDEPGIRLFLESL